MLRFRLLSTLLALVALVAMGFAMYATGRSERRTATTSAARVAAGDQMLLGMLDQETAVRGFLFGGREEFLDPFHAGLRETAGGERELAAMRPADARVTALMARHHALQRRWLALAREAIAQRRRDPPARGSLAASLRRKALMDEIRAVNAALHRRLAQIGDGDMRASTGSAGRFVVLLTLLIGLTTFGLVRRETRKRRRQYDDELSYRIAQRAFTDALAVTTSEADAHAVLERHLAGSVPASTATVVTGDDDVPGAPARAHRTSRPLVVGGRVIGSVVLLHDAPLDERADRCLSESASQAAPVLANLRNLAIAERRASTDVLTGLPNRRAMLETLQRMAAQASRCVQPLAAVAVDLDRFKAINDDFGHDMGDAVLEHVGALLRATVRASDFVARIGGEEFLVLAPATDARGACVLAESLRAAIERARVPGLDGDLSGSFGVAAMPDDTCDARAMLRLADRALYAAKDGGRNRVERAPSVALQAV